MDALNAVAKSFSVALESPALPALGFAIVAAYTVVKLAKVGEAWMIRRYELERAMLRYKVQCQRLYEFVNAGTLVGAAATSAFLITKIFIEAVVTINAGMIAFGGIWLTAGTVIALNCLLARLMSTEAGPKWGT